MADGGKADSDIESLFASGLRRLAIDVDPTGLQNLLVYFAELKKWSRSINLVSRHASAAEIVEKHFLDSLSLLYFLDKQEKENTSGLLDVGSGAGFPGLVVKAVRPHLQVTLCEPRLKRVSFLRHITRKINLFQVEVSERRVEEMLLSEKEFTWITSRAVAEPKNFIHMIEHLLTPRTKIILMLAAENVDRQKDDLANLGLAVEELVAFTLPFSENRRQLALISSG